MYDTPAGALNAFTGDDSVAYHQACAPRLQLHCQERAILSPCDYHLLLANIGVCVGWKLDCRGHLSMVEKAHRSCIQVCMDLIYETGFWSMMTLKLEAHLMNIK